MFDRPLLVYCTPAAASTICIQDASMPFKSHWHLAVRVGSSEIGPEPLSTDHAMDVDASLTESTDTDPASRLTDMAAVSCPGGSIHVVSA